MIALRAGILGCGGIAQKHTQAIVGLEDQVELVAFRDRDEGKAAPFPISTPRAGRRSLPTIARCSTRPT